MIGLDADQRSLGEIPGDGIVKASIFGIFSKFLYGPEGGVYLSSGRKPPNACGSESLTFSLWPRIPRIWNGTCNTRVFRQRMTNLSKEIDHP